MFAQFELNAIELIAMMHGDAFGEARLLRIFLGLVGDDDYLLHTFGGHLLRDHRHRQGSVVRLAAGHRDRVVEQNLVRDRNTGRDRGAHRERPGVVIRAVAQVREDVLGVGKRRLPDPGHAFPAHLRIGTGVAVHPDRHVVAADAGHRARPFGHDRRCVVRAARAVKRRAFGDDSRLRERLFLGVDHGKTHLHARADLRRQFELADPLRDRLGDDRRREFVVRRQDPVALRHRPLAAVLFVELADHARHAFAGADPREQLFLHRILEQLALFLDHQNFFEPFGKRAHCGCFERPHHAAFEQADADVLARLLVEPQVGEGLACVQIRLAAGDDAEAGMR